MDEIKQIRAVIKAKDVLKYLSVSELKVQYKGKKLGFLWAILDPLIYLLIYLLLVKVIFQRGTDEFPALLFCGIIAHRWFGQSISSSVNCIVGNGKLIQTVKVPLLVFPLSKVWVSTVNFLIGLALLFPILFFLKINFSLNIFWLPLIVVLQLLFNIVYSSIAAFVGVFFKDLKNIITFSVRLLLYLSPVLYDVTSIPEKLYKPYMILNPFAGLFTSYKNVLVHGESPSIYLLSLVIYVLIGFFVMFWANGKGNLYVKYL